MDSLIFFQATIDYDGFSMVLKLLDHHQWMFLFCFCFCGEPGMRYRMPSRKEICKLSGDNDREDKDRELSDFLCGTPKSWWALTAPEWECTSQTCSWWSTMDCQRICGRFHRLLEEQAGTKLHKPSPSSFTGRDWLRRQLQHQKWGKSLLESNAGEKQSTMLFHLALCTRLMRNQLITTSALSLVASLGLFAGDWCRWLIDWLIDCRCLCCSSCTGQCGCIAASQDSDFILQELLIGNPCTSYLGVKIAASKMIGFNDLPSSSESDIWHVLSSCRMLRKFLVRFSKWLQSVKKVL